MTRLIIVDADGLFRTSLRKLTRAANDIEVVAETGEVGEALDLLTAADGKVLLLGIENLERSHLSVLQQVVRVAPRTRVILAARSADDSLVMDAFRVGLWGFVKKSGGNALEIIRSIRTVGHGGSFLNPHLTALVFDEFVRLGTRTRAGSRAGRS